MARKAGHNQSTQANLKRLLEDEDLFDNKERLQEYTTVLFADLVDSTAYKAARPVPHGLRKTLRHNDEAQRIVEHHGGVIVKHIGDAIMARFDFGNPGPHAAINTAIAIMERFEGLNGGVIDPFEQLHSRIGIATGVCCDFLDGDPQGSSVDLAARLQSFAKPDQILVDSKTTASADIGKLSSAYQKANTLPSNSILPPSAETRAFKGIGNAVNVHEVVWDGKKRHVDVPPPKAIETGFLTSEFYSDILKRCARDLVITGNGLRKLTHHDFIETAVQAVDERRIQISLILMNPFSDLAGYCSLLSRGIDSIRDLQEKVLESMWAMRTLKNRGGERIRIYSSPLANIIPMAKVDETFMVSFPVLQDKITPLAVGRGPYLQVDSRSSFGSRLKHHLAKVAHDQFLLDESFFREPDRAKFKKNVEDFMQTRKAFPPF